MIQKEVIREILLENRKEVELQHVVPRNFQMEDFANYVLIGVRRAGKSFMLYQQIQQNLKRGITWDSMLYINFEDERLMGMTAQELNLILEVHGMMSKERPILFLDEIQNIDGWEKFVRRIADMKYKISITGSNSKMLSSEIASTLGGRFVIMNIYPYSFAEYLIANGKEKNYLDTISTSDKAELLAQYNEYVTYGAFPELVEIKNKRTFLSSIYLTVYLGDIITRNKITNDFAVKLILKKIAESITKPLSFTRLTNIAKNAGTSLGKQTVINYVGYMNDSYLIFPLTNYAAKLVEKETSPKYYFMDTGLVGLMLLDCKSAQLENLVAIELVRRYGMENVFYFENNVEIDFYVPDEKLAIQVSLQVLDDMDTRERETRAFVKLHNFIPDAKCLIITNSEEASIECDGIPISVLPAWKWLLETP